MAVFAGAISLDVDGITFAVGDGGTYQEGSIEYESIVGQPGLVGQKSKGVIPMLSIKAFLDEGVSVASIKKRNVTVILECRDRTLTLSGGTFQGSGDVDLSDMSVTALFHGSSLTEVF